MLYKIFFNALLAYRNIYTWMKVDHLRREVLKKKRSERGSKYFPMKLNSGWPIISLSELFNTSLTSESSH